MTRKVLVTAGASGIGKHIAAAFLAAGDDVYVCDINSDALKIASTNLPGLKTGVCDVTDQSKKMILEAADKLGGIDVLVNNAGTSGPTAPVQDLDPDLWDQVLQVQPERHVPGDEVCNSAPHTFRKRGHHHHVLCGRSLRIPEPQRLFDGEMGADRVYEDAFDRARRTRRAGECNPSRRGAGGSHTARVRRSCKGDRQEPRRSRGTRTGQTESQAPRGSGRNRRTRRLPRIRRCKVYLRAGFANRRRYVITTSAQARAPAPG
jgi:NAD(P)-dependent dehydrogenase (short-subunit alcohol dehydrogenase family)